MKILSNLFYHKNNMMGRKTIVVGNWKMNKNLFDGMALAAEIIRESSKLAKDSVEVILAPPFPYLHTCISMGKRHPQIKIAAQNCHHKKEGAFTGEVAAFMLKSMEIDYIIIGHSERRKYFNETHDILAEKIRIAIEEGLKVIFCCGEPLDVRNENTHQSFVKKQLEDSLYQLKEEHMTNIVIAYEPVWAIGTGVTATPVQAQEMHAYIRMQIEQQYNAEVADNLTILYGGSVKPNNAKELFSNPDVDGGLVGGASLKKDDFMQIVRASIK